MKISKHFFLYLTLVIAFTGFLLSFFPFTSSILVAVIFGLGISYWYDNIFVRMKKKKKVAIACLLSFAFLVVIGTSLSATVRVYNLTIGEERTDTFNSLKEGRKALFAGVEQIRVTLNRYGMNIQPITEDNLIKSWGKNFQATLMNTTTQLGQYVSSITDFLLGIFVFVIFLSLMLWYRHKIEEAVANENFLGGPRIKHLYRKAQFSSYASVLTIFSVGFIQTIVMTLGAAAVGFNESAIIFITTLIFSFFPVLGTAPMGLALSGIAFLQSDNRAGFIMLGVALFVGIVDNWLKPYIVSQQGPQIHPLISLVGIIGAVVVFGVPGLFIGPFLMIFVPYLKDEVRALIKPTETLRPVRTQTPHRDANV